MEGRGAKGEPGREVAGEATMPGWTNCRAKGMCLNAADGIMAAARMARSERKWRSAGSQLPLSGRENMKLNGVHWWVLPAAAQSQIECKIGQTWKGAAQWRSRWPQSSLLIKQHRCWEREVLFLGRGGGGVAAPFSIPSLLTPQSSNSMFILKMCHNKIHKTSIRK